jgi:hypothetical protein
VGYLRGPTVALCVASEDLLDEYGFANEIQKYDLPEVKFDLATMCVLESFFDLWFEFILCMRELESLVSELKMRCSF